MHTYNPHEGEPRDYNNPQILHHRVQQELLLQARFDIMHNKYFQSLIVQRKINDSSNNITRCHDEAHTWHHSALSLLAGDGSHSTDQPGGRVHGQVKLATVSSNVSPKNKATSKAEYTNTQQGSPD
jgi:hypothetical protein